MFKLYTGKPFNEHSCKNAIVKYVKFKGEVVFPVDKPEPYEQHWSDDQPSEHNTPIPIDSISTEVIITGASKERIFQYTEISDAISTTVDMISSQNETVFKTNTSIDTISTDISMISVTKEQVEL